MLKIKKYNKKIPKCRRRNKPISKHKSMVIFIHLLKDTPSNLIKIASTHNIKEIELANQYGADFITFSPIFATPNKGEPKGLEALKEAVKISKAKVIALGGIMSAEQICAVMKCGVAGFASIRYFTLD